MQITIIVEGQWAEGKTTTAGVIAKLLRSLGAVVTVDDDELVEGGDRPPFDVLEGKHITIEVRQKPPVES